jgi:hypothetical protein
MIVVAVLKDGTVNVLSTRAAECVWHDDQLWLIEPGKNVPGEHKPFEAPTLILQRKSVKCDKHISSFFCVFTFIGEDFHWRLEPPSGVEAEWRRRLIEMHQNLEFLGDVTA